MSRNDVILLASLILVLALALAFAPASPRQTLPPRQPAGLEEGIIRKDGMAFIDINRAGEELLTAFDGIGETLARRIREDREVHGPYDRVEDLIRVKGIGPGTLEKLGPRAAVQP